MLVCVRVGLVLFSSLYDIHRASVKPTGANHLDMQPAG